MGQLHFQVVRCAKYWDTSHGKLENLLLGKPFEKECTDDLCDQIGGMK